MVFPAFVDMHTHLDKGHIWPRSPNPTAPSRARCHRSAPTAPRAGRAGCAPAHVLRAALPMPTAPKRSARISIPSRRRTRSPGPSSDELQADWAGRIDLQAVCLIGADGGRTRPAPSAHRRSGGPNQGGVLGMVTYPLPDLRDGWKPSSRMAAERGLGCRFPRGRDDGPLVETLRQIAQMVRRPASRARSCAAIAAPSVQDESAADSTPGPGG
jgi:cytosine deaminase